MTIELPDDLGRAVADLAAAEGFESVADFIAAQIEDCELTEVSDGVTNPVDFPQVEPDDDSEYLEAVAAERNGTTPPEVAELKRLLDADRKGPPVVVDATFWDRCRTAAATGTRP